jgi:tripartite-type tricarboxylate transporter receptor subunit TctC
LNYARVLAPELGNRLGVQVVVENRPGGALTIGIDAVAKSPPAPRSAARAAAARPSSSAS